MQVTVYGENYTGSHFRGFEDGDDGHIVKMVLKGKERKIVDFILENFSYGSEDDVGTIDELRAGYKRGDIPQFDGCGGVLKLENEAGEEVYFAKDFVTKKEFKKAVIIDLGEIKVNKYKETTNKLGGTTHSAYDVVNDLIRDR